MDLEELVNKIKEVRIQGARRIALESLRFLENLAAQRGFGPEFEEACERLRSARPTAVVLFNCLEELKRVRSREKLRELISRLESSPEKIAGFSGKLGRNLSILTHCHSTEAVALIKAVEPEVVYATETRPLYQGVKTAEELSESGIETVLITDSASGAVIRDVDVAIFGCDAIRREGVVNKVGTLPMAALTRAFGKKVIFAGTELKLDRREVFTLEERDPSEVHPGIPGVKIRNPAFDVTPWRFVSGFVTDVGYYPGDSLRDRI